MAQHLTRKDWRKRRKTKDRYGNEFEYFSKHKCGKVCNWCESNLMIKDKKLELKFKQELYEEKA